MKSSIGTHEGRLALVTGASQGIGQAITLALAERGAKVIATELHPPEDTANKIGPRASAFQLDVTREEDWRSVAAKSQDLGEVDIVVNNAGYFPNRSIEELYLTTWRKTMATNLDSHFLGAKYCLPGMRRKKWGPLRRNLLEYGWPHHTWYEPLHHHENGDHWVHARFGQ